jgi:aspartyl-tRNA(Asn)/glutamyl-tRNA(Gln) amidotransferase subunit B
MTKFMKYDVIIGLEIHAELKTKSKMFCACHNESEGLAPNTCVCPICLGHPGTLPVPNKRALDLVLLAGLALDCRINELSKFDRKNYFYPDLTKGYQISQYDLPLAYGGWLAVENEAIGVTRIHIEEDTGKSSHPENTNYTLLDFNRAGTPLLEMVTEPVIRTAASAKKFCQNFQRILRYLEISDADMEKGQMRCEANISLQVPGHWRYDNAGHILPIGDKQLNAKVEVKNINSFRAVEKAINFEIVRQTKALDEGETIIQETRGWNDSKNETVSQRVKESSADYRYFPEPDIPPLRIGSDWLEAVKSELIELPEAKKIRFISEYNLNPESAETLTGDKHLAAYAEKVISELRAWAQSENLDWDENSATLIKAGSNLIINELLKHLNQDKMIVTSSRVTPENMAQLVTLIFSGKINSSAASQILEAMHTRGDDPVHLMLELNLEQTADAETLHEAIGVVLARYPEQADECRAGKTPLLQFFLGQVMAQTKGKANPQATMEALKKEMGIV